MAGSFGRLLREKRESRYISLPEAELATRIKAEHLRAVEEERFDDLPGGMYIEVYLREYARFLDLDPEVLVEGFQQRVRWPRLWQRLGRGVGGFLRANFLPLLLGVLLIGLAAGVVWLLMNPRQAEAPPLPPAPTPRVVKQLILVHPPEGAVITTPEVTLVGQVPAGAVVLINGELVQPQADGHFAHTVALELGETRLMLEASDSAGWQADLQRLVLRPTTTPLPPLLPASRDVPGEHQVIVNQIDVTHYPEMVTYFSVFDARGEPWPALTTENLALEEDDEAIGEFFLSTVPPTEPLAVALVVDVSGSMEGEPLAQAQAALQTFVENLGPDDTACLIAFDENVTLLQGFTTDKGVLTNTVSALRAGGDTALYDAVLYGVEQVATQPYGRRSVIILTDGQDTASTATLDQAIARAGLLDIPIHALGLESPDFEGAPLEQLAQETGAVYLLAPEAAALGDLYAQLGRQLQGQYRVIYSSPGGEVEERRLTLTTQINGVIRQSSKSYRVP